MDEFNSRSDTDEERMSDLRDQKILYRTQYRDENMRDKDTQTLEQKTQLMSNWSSKGKGEKGGEATLKEVEAKKFLELMRDTKPQFKTLNKSIAP